MLADEFLSWVLAANRHFLQSTPPKVDIVVVQDKFGSYMTISEAVATIANKTDRKRLAIYVKQGVYKETVEIKTSNLTFIGDGIDVRVSVANGHLLQSVPPKVDVVVVQDMSGNYATIPDVAVAVANKTDGKRLVIYVKH
ncbi:pectinesterase 2-like [Mangifera indica]|uniref:pectinesterase 2-like n=1 Tax=Mangifera indica TaxID=29780 RepID=UPI001CFB33C4|nr:pectinesterase 2-like [Mangifera indica]